MANININYRSALVLKHALKRQIEEKENTIKSLRDVGQEIDIEYLKDYEIELRVYEDFKQKIGQKFKNYTNKKTMDVVDDMFKEYKNTFEELAKN